MDGFVKDIQYGVRSLVKRPGFTVIAVLTLALGIGVNTALFTVFNAFALRPLPLKNPDSLVRISGVDRDGQQQNLFSYLDYVDYRDRTHVLSGLVAWNKVAATLGETAPRIADDSVLASDREYVPIQMVSSNYFSVLGERMSLGRALLPDGDQAPGTHPEIVLRYGFWQRRFNSDPRVVGQTLKIQGQPFTVVGVAARDFIGTEPDAPAGWVPLMMRDQLIGDGGWNHKSWLTDRSADSFVLLGQLKPAVSRDQAQAQLSLVAQQLAQNYAGRNRKTGVTLKSGMAFINIGAEQLPIVAPLFLAVGLVLLITCANVANLLLARAATRRKEIAVRLALGATRGRLVRQLLTESLLISFLGGAAALLLTMWTLSALYPIVLSWVPLPAGLKDSFTINLSPDYRIFAYTLLASLVAGIAAGLAPALQASKPDLTSALKEESSTLGQRLRRSGLRSVLVMTQIAVCLMLLIGAGVLVRNARKAQTVDTGFDTKNVFTVAASLREQEPGARNLTEVRRELAERIRALPGVKSVTQAYRQPLTGMPPTTAITISGKEASDRELRANYNFVAPNYFETMNLRLVRGHSFNEQEVNSGAAVVVISESTAQRFWPGEEAIGKHIGIAASRSPTAATPTWQSSNSSPVFPTFEIIGIARDTRSGWVWQKDETFVYLPLGPDSQLGAYFLVRTEGDPQYVMSAVRSQAEAVNPNLLVSVRKVADSMEYQLAPFRAIAMVAGALGMLALVLASIGLYGVMSFLVNQRRSEIGIRIALGARSSDVIKLFLAQGFRLISVGIVCGIAGGAVISQLFATVLIDLSPLDPPAFAGVSIFLTLVALLATYIPARRATKVDPLVALRYE